MKRNLCLVLALGASVVAWIYLMPLHGQTPEEANAKAQKTVEQYQRMLDRSDALLTRQEEFIGKQETAFKRWEKILDPWERQQKEYQKYLDALPKK